MPEMTNCIALGVSDKEAAAERWKALGFERGKETADWIEVLAGPLRLFLVEDGTRDVAFAFTSADLVMAKAELQAQGFRIDEQVSEQAGEMFLRDPDGHLFNLS